MWIDFTRERERERETSFVSTHPHIDTQTGSAFLHKWLIGLFAHWWNVEWKVECTHQVACPYTHTLSHTHTVATNDKVSNSLSHSTHNSARATSLQHRDVAVNAHWQTAAATDTDTEIEEANETVYIYKVQSIRSCITLCLCARERVSSLLRTSERAQWSWEREFIAMRRALVYEMKPFTGE